MYNKDITVLVVVLYICSFYTINSMHSLSNRLRVCVPSLVVVVVILLLLKPVREHAAVCCHRSRARVITKGGKFSPYTPVPAVYPSHRARPVDD